MRNYPNNKQESIGIEDPTKDPLSSAFLILELTELDQGDLSGRDKKSEYLQRKPHCVEWSADSLSLTITNLGKVASDLVKIEYELVFCTANQHGPNDGFNTQHAGEISSSTKDDNSFLDFIPARGKQTLTFPIELPSTQIINLYFRARVSTLWSGRKPPNEWDILTDAAVTEAWTRLI